MKIIKTAKKISAVLLACTISLSSVISGMIVTADTMSELEAKQAKLDEELQEVEWLLSEYEDKADEADKYLEEYDVKMKVQEDQVKVVEEQITLYEEELAALEEDIAAKEAEFTDGIEQFRQRLRALYMAGNDSLASVIAGSSDFYDMLARMEFVERVSKHDNDLIDSLSEQIADLEATKAEYEETLAQLEKKKDEEEAYYEELRETYNGHAETKQMHENMIADYEARADEIADEQAEVEEELQAEIRRLQEEAERKRKEEEERKRKEEEKKRQEAEANGETYVPEAATPTYSETGFIWPVPTVRNTSDLYGERWIVEEQSSDFHKGIDITKPGCAGETIVASAGGTVIQASDKGNGYGKCVIIDHGNGIATLYAHCSQLYTSMGDTVAQGDPIGAIGCTGYAYGNHLHFEVRVDGQHTNPSNYVNINN
ncbi:MAG: peptidoglycan DD-metalloendopeptidase family protein [Oscillospiraceae bacterium]|nr:peptidoglycan DD-metalloendopeptidase family protein [Oscillospiraceae bacterium]